MDVEELLFVSGQLLSSSTTKGIYTPIVEDGGAPVVTTEALTVHATLSIFLTGIQHKRILLHQYRGYHGRNTLASVSSKEVAGNTLFVVVLQEIEHVFPDIVGLLPGIADG